ncbi:hypothetical protein IW261DRAFT_1604208 [Armillaria novae-zelandiae]|uniref:Uncharacterized protein n=1 Tax=Armillaria novae-zelandiae TaxID=153914 RepID=A0AA39PKN0_9AGAR|nr:hypothetical protein IW261DRAFT_1604208 [Armillaria novae-zelandiae]
MCNLETEGTKHGCGHYIKTRTIRKIDCGSSRCLHSSRHPNDPNHDCSNSGCNRYLGPDRGETVTRTTADYCTQCEYWYRGPGSRPRK